LAKNRISQLRKSRGLTQRALAELAETSQQQVQRIEAGVQGVRLELAARIANALGVKLGEIFPSLAIPRRRKSTRTSRPSKEASGEDKFLEAGIDPDPRHWTVKFFASDGRVFSYDLSSDEKSRLERLFGRRENGMVVFETNSRWVALNSKKIAAIQFLFEAGVGFLVEDEDEDKDNKMTLHLCAAKEPVVFGLEPDARPLDDDDDGSLSQLQNMFLTLESGLEDEPVWFDDIDGERVYLRTAEILIIEVPLICCEPALWNAYSDGLDEDEAADKSSSSERVSR